LVAKCGVVTSARGRCCSKLGLLRSPVHQTSLPGRLRASRNVLLLVVLWFGGSLTYGVASYYLGSLGPIVGWPVFMSLIVICASVLGWISGEWRTSTRRPLQLHVAGIALLVLALF